MSLSTLRNTKLAIAREKGSGEKCLGSKSYCKKKAMPFKVDPLFVTEYKLLPRITALEIMNKLLKLLIYD